MPGTNPEQTSAKVIKVVTARNHQIAKAAPRGNQTHRAAQHTAFALTQALRRVRRRFLDGVAGRTVLPHGRPWWWPGVKRS
jgi:hypothetical protein